MCVYIYIYISPGLLIEINMEMSHFELFHYMRIQLNHVEMLITKRLREKEKLTVRVAVLTGFVCRNGVGEFLHCFCVTYASQHCFLHHHLLGLIRI